MQIKLTFRPDGPLVIPYNYNYQLQSAIYAMLRNVGESDFWHDNGFGDQTVFKGFCFSGLGGRYSTDRENRKLIFDSDVHLEVRSSEFEFIDSFQRALERYPYLKLFDTRLRAVSCSLENRHLTGGSLILKAETPVVVHETADDRHTYFFSPSEEEYCDRICLNAEKKYETITGNKPDSIKIATLGEFRKTVTKYQGFFITGYTGEFELNTSLRMAEFIYNIGLGEKTHRASGLSA